MEVSVDREYIAYHISFSRFESLELKIAAESLKYVLSPLLLEYEIDRLRESVIRDSEGISSNQQLLELAHSLAYRDQGLGNLLYARDVEEHLGQRQIHKYLRQNYLPGNMTIVGTGMSQASLNEVTGKLFDDVGIDVAGSFPEIKNLPPLPDDLPTLQSSNWYGGEIRKAGLGNTQMLVAYPAASLNSKNEGAFHIARAYLENLATIPAINERSVNFNAYSDAGMISVYSTSDEGNGKAAFNAVNNAMKTLSGITDKDFEVAKTAALTKHIHDISSLSSLATQISRYGRLHNENEIGSVTFSEFKATVSPLSQSTPAVVASGDVRGI